MEVKSRASGIWDRIITNLAPSITPALERPGLQHIDCPIHGGANDFRVFRDVAESGGGVCTCGTWPDGLGLISAVNNWSFIQTLEAVASLILGAKPTLTPLTPKQSRRRDTAREDRAIRFHLKAIWGGSYSLDAPEAEPARRYFANRGLIPKPASVRYHPSLSYHKRGILTGHYPALVALVQTPDGQPVCIHRTYLTVDGYKAPVLAPKKLCSHPSDRPLQGAAIRLFPAGKTLAVAEGIETSIAVTRLTGIPCWATVTAGLMECFTPPQGVENVLIFADKDRPSAYHPTGHGQESARILVERLWKLGIKAGLRIPPLDIPDGKKGIDWLDCLEQQKTA